MAFTSHASNQYFHRAVICLNNVGVTLIERGCFEQALQTLVDAAAVVKDVASTVLNQSDAVLTANMVSTKLHEAHGRLACPQGHGQAVTPLHIVAVCDDEAPIGGIPVPSEGNAAEHVIHVIRIGVLDNDFLDISGSEIMYESLVVLFNRAMAYMCLSSFTQVPEAVQHYQTLALHLLNKSYSLLCVNCRGDIEDGCLTRLVLLAVLFLRKLITLTQDFGLTNDIDEYSTRLVMLERLWNNTQGLVQMNSYASAAGSA